MRLAIAAIVIAGALVYSSGLSTPFMFDDANSVENNAQIRQLWPLSVPLSPPADTPVAARPLVNLTLAIDYAIHGAGVRGYHVGNLAIHLIAAILLFVVARRTLLRLGPPAPALSPSGRDRPKRGARTAAAVADDRPPVLAGAFGAALAEQATVIAAVIALVWTVHPLNSEVVEYVSQRTESLMACFYLLTVYCAIGGLEERGRSGRWAIGAVAACAAGMACKESMVTAPLMVMLYDRLFAFASWREAWRRRSRLYVALAATWAVLTLLITSGGRTSAGFSAGTSPWVYLLNQAEIVAHYLRLAVWPRDLVLDYGLPRELTLSAVIAPGLLVLALLAVAAFVLVRWGAAGFPGAWFFLTLAPTSSVIPIATEVGAERRMYLPLMALIALAVIGLFRLAWGVAGARRSAYVVAIAGVCVAALAAAGTVARIGEYRSRLTIAQTIVERRPNGRGHFLLAFELMNAGQEEAAIEELRKSTSEYRPGHYGLGVELASTGHYDEAIVELETFIRLMPESGGVIPARELLGRLLYEQGQFDAAADQFTRILDAVPTHARARQYLAALRARTRPN